MRATARRIGRIVGQPEDLEVLTTAYFTHEYDENYDLRGDDDPIIATLGELDELIERAVVVAIEATRLLNGEGRSHD